MYIKTKCLYLKEGIDGKELEKYGFYTLNDGDSYWIHSFETFESIGWYKDSRRFVFKYPRNVKAKFILKKLNGRVPNDMLEIRNTWEWLTIFGRWQNYSNEKFERINKKLEELNEKEKRKCQ